MALPLTVFVILWGAMVRATGSGAGCGEHWPLCNGEVVPLARGTKTLIEYLHRITSGIDFLVVVGSFFILKKQLKQASPRLITANRVALASMIVEAGLGAVLVKLGLVEQNQSVLRASVIMLHLINTMVLVAALTMLHFRNSLWLDSAFARPLRSGSSWVMLFITMATAATGALAALGDTLFPATTLLAGLEHDFADGAHFLIRLRILHPFAAVFLCFFCFFDATWSTAITPRLQATLRTKAGQFKILFISLVLAQTMLGVVNLALLAPVYMQVLHLGVANLLWIVMVIYVHMKEELPVHSSKIV